MVEQGIFLTKENLAFSMPLILTCLIYIGVPIVVAALVIYLISAQFEKQRAKKLTNLDESVIKELIGEYDDKENKVDDAAIRKAKNKVKQRLAKERKASKQNNKGKKGGGGDDDDIDTDALLTFAGKKK